MSEIQNKKEQILPKTIPVFPLKGVLLLPEGNLPLNIFEERYLAMVDDALRTDRLIGMVQPLPTENKHNPGDKSDLCAIGCAGRITSFQETEDGRYLITMKGVQKFRVESELDVIRGYRRVEASWGFTDHQNVEQEDLSIDKDELVKILLKFFQKHAFSMDMDLLLSVPDDKLVTALSMICPMDPKEKQALLEAGSHKERYDLLFKILYFDIENTAHGNHTAH